MSIGMKDTNKFKNKISLVKNINAMAINMCVNWWNFPLLSVNFWLNIPSKKSPLIGEISPYSKVGIFLLNIPSKKSPQIGGISPY